MTTNSSRESVRRALVAGVVLAVIWGPLALGSVAPWAYVPLAVLSTLVGGAALLLERSGRPPLGILAAGLGAVALATALQLLPMQQPLLAKVSPATDDFMQRHDFAYTMAVSGADAAVNGDDTVPRLPISVSPGDTTLALLLFSSFALLLLGTVRLASRTGGHVIVHSLVVFGAVLAVIGIVQKAVNGDAVHPKIYGIWTAMKGNPFGPFINPNHFAGWMLLAIPLALGLFADALQRTQAAMASSRYGRVAIVNTPDFGWLLGYGFSAAVMALSLSMTRSRSGLAAFAASGLLMGWMIVRQQRRTSTRVIASSLAVLFLVGAVAWAGFDTAFSKFIDGREDLASVGGRLGAWRDTLAFVRLSPWTGIGLNAYGTAMQEYQTGSRVLLFDAAHNDYLQLIAEGGALLCAPVLTTLAIFALQVRRRFKEAPKTGTTYWLRVGAVVGLVAIALQEFVEFSLQLPGVVVFFAVVAAIALHQSPRLRQTPDRA